MRLRSPASLPERSGRVRGGRASPGAVVELPFRRSRPAPRSRFPRALRLAALASGLTGSPPMTLLPSARGGHDFRRRSAQEARGEQAEAIHRPPQGPPRYPSPGLHRSTTARRHRGAGSDALPTDGMGRVWHAAKRGWFVTLFFIEGHLNQRVGRAEYADNRRMGRASNPFSP
jgi:hypothetical protein